MASRTELAQRLNAIQKALSERHVSLSLVEGEELETKADAYTTQISLGEGVTAAQRNAEATVVGLNVRILALRGEIRSLEEEQNSLRFLIKYNMEGVI
jgi:hypothetical protein